MALEKKTMRPKTSHVERMFRTHEPLEEIHRAEQVQEDNHFRQLDHELIVALREKSAIEIEQAIRTYTRMRCPKCGDPLAEMSSHRGTIDACPGCGGIWLGKGEWEGLVGPKEHCWLQRLFAGLIASK